MAETVYTGVTDAAGIQGQLFRGKKFWLSQKVPQRKRFMADVKANGGEISALDKEADIKIVDHARKEQLPGTYSYQYIEFSVRNGALEDLEEHAVGSSMGTARIAGSTIQPPRSARTKFTPEDDRVLVDWVHQVERDGGATSGNEIYKQLEAKNPRHTWQSWRDRWVKTLKILPRSASIPQNAPPTPPAERTGDANEAQTVLRPQQAAYKPFTEEDKIDLFQIGDDIMKIHPDRLDEAWTQWAEGREDPEAHSAQQWRDLWETLRPIYLERKAKETEGSSGTQTMHSATIEVNDHRGHEQGATDLAVRVTPSKTKVDRHDTARSPSYHPESPTKQAVEASSEPMIRKSTGPFVDGPSDAHHSTGSPGKRKRLASEEVKEVPSSSPAESIRSTKRLRHYEEEESLFIEIGSSSERDHSKSPPKEIPDTFATNNPDGKHIIDVINIDDSSDSLEEESYYSEKSHSLSPELGQSPIKSSNETQRNVSKTQAIFDEPEVPGDFDLALPDGGFIDEDQDDLAEAIRNAAQEIDPEGLDRRDNERAEELQSLEDEQLQDAQRIPSNTNDSKHNSIPPSSPSQTSPNPHQSITQAILAGETQHLDFSLPEPDGGWDAALLPSSPPEFPPSSPQDPQHQRKVQPSQDHSPLKTTHHYTQPQVPRTPSPNPADQLDEFIDYHISQGYSEDTIHTALKCTNMDPALTVEVLRIMSRNGEKVPGGVKGCWTEGDDADLESVDARRVERVERKHGVGSMEVRWRFLEEYRR